MHRVQGRNYTLTTPLCPAPPLYTGSRGVPVPLRYLPALHLLCTPGPGGHLYPYDTFLPYTSPVHRVQGGTCALTAPPYPAPPLRTGSRGTSVSLRHLPTLHLPYTPGEGGGEGHLYPCDIFLSCDSPVHRVQWSSCTPGTPLPCDYNRQGYTDRVTGQRGRRYRWSETPDCDSLPVTRTEDTQTPGHETRPACDNHPTP